ncbi:tRNA (adenosine(37)-N6)-threonylcarbamoyltransferase complex dimerization subunit type 1 TsaB [Cytobacillus suaedae]|nr:tRNA (adenosine(37)-N6)-threonylcarbamoyltransferase complex dimerization subunit type 1 TsaB [Cytobacillus suaedae]
MKVLAIDTSNYVMGIAILDGADVVGEVITNLKKNHSIRVMPAIHQLLQECDIKPNELEKIVVAHGPGSYTGVRIGVTIAKTLAWSLKIPLVGVSSLEVLAANGHYFQGNLSPIFDARRGQVYTGLYAYEEGQFFSKKNDRIVLLVDWLKELKEENQKVLFLGNDLAIHKETIQEELEDLAIFAPSGLNNPRPSELAILGVTREEEEDIHSFVPNYIRMVEAETNWIASQNK